MSHETMTLPAKATFPHGGLHPPDGKAATERQTTEVFPTPKSVVIPLSQHLGAPCEPLVKKGDEVKIGTVIGASDRFVSALVHSTVSGKVKAVDHMPHPLGARVAAVEIASDGEDVWEEGVDLSPDIFEPDYGKTDGWVEKIKAAGIVGMGGAGFPTHIKLSPPAEKPIDTVLFNGAECEPYLTADHRVMLERPKEVLIGCKIIQSILKAQRAVVGIEDNKPDAIAKMREAAQDIPGVEIVVCKTRYPQGGEKQLIKAILDREVPSRGLPLDVGVVVDNVGTCLAVYQAVVKNRPLVDRVVTITGPGIPKPRNLVVRIGTRFAEILEACDVTVDPGDKVIMGGPMMGRAVRRLDVPVVKATSGILVFPQDSIRESTERPCVRCARCVEACPMGLVPTQLAAAVRAGKYDKLESMGIHDCMECGSCSYTCPASIDLVHWIRLGKFEASALSK